MNQSPFALLFFSNKIAFYFMVDMNIKKWIKE